jgi:adenylate/guanylate cyclase family protein
VVRAIGNDLHMDYSAVGQTTHLAARMEQLATPGTIRLTAATLRLVEGLVQVQALGPIPVKGIPEPVEVFELVGASTLRGRLQAAAARGLTRFVGREAELTAVRQALEQAGAGHGQVVAVVGEAGVGSPAWCTSVSMPTTRRAGGCWRVPPCPTARRRPIFRSWICSSATSTSRTRMSRVPCGPRSPGRC